MPPAKAKKLAVESKRLTWAVTELDKLIKHIYANNALEQLFDEKFLKMPVSYESEQKEFVKKHNKSNRKL